MINIVYLADEVKQYFKSTPNYFEQIMALEGQCFRHREGRKTQRIQLGQQNYFVKQYLGVGWKEIFKNIFQLRLPVISALNEWRAIKKLRTLGINTATVVACGQKGFNPARLKSFLLMEELNAISLEDLTKPWQNSPPAFVVKQAIIKKLAFIARTLHQNGINHRDFYICHFLLDLSHSLLNPEIYLLDLHRAQLRYNTPQRWIIKDLAALFFSSKNSGLTQRDLYRFMKIYQQASLKDVLGSQYGFWKKVKLRGERLYATHTLK